MNVETRLAKLERMNRILVLSLVATLVGIVGLAAAPGQDTMTVRELHITSPDAKSTLTLSASPTATGMWINDVQNKRAELALYTDGQNSVVSTANAKTGQLDCAIASTPKGPVVQVHGNNGRAINITANSWKPPAGVQEEQFNIQFVPSYNSSASGTRVRSGTE